MLNSIKSPQRPSRPVPDSQNANDFLIIYRAKVDDVRINNHRSNRSLEILRLIHDHCAMRNVLNQFELIHNPIGDGIGILR